MATPLTPDRFLAALRAELRSAGLRVIEVGHWRRHNRNRMGAWGPVHGVMLHHTVTRGTEATVAICRDGYSTLPGPLCHGVIAKNGDVYLVGYGRANHAGLGDDDVLRAVIAERSLPADNEANTDGNARFYGFECENLGNGRDPWPARQVEAMVRVSAAVCRAHGWGRAGDTSVIGHAEWQPGKVDPRGISGGMSGIRRRVVDRLKHPASWSPGDGDAGTEPDTAPEPAPQPEPEPTPEPEPEPEPSGTYTVQRGDTLWSIADSTLGAGARYREIAELNNLTNADELTPGQVLRLPVTTYTVAKGDTLWSIAEALLDDGARHTEIAELNELPDGDDITPGQTLTIPPK